MSHLRRVLLWCAAQTGRFVPSGMRGDPDLSRRANLLVGLSFVSAVFGFLFFVLSLIDYGVPLISACAGAVFAIGAATPWVLRRSTSLVLTTSGLLAVFMGAMFLSALSVDGQAALSLPWLATIPLLGVMLAGSRVGAFWALACVGLAKWHAEIDQWLDIPKRAVSAEALRGALAINAVYLVLFVLAFALVHESSRKQMVTELSEARERLDSTREKALLVDHLASIGQLAAGVAHEINNPMTFVSANVSLLREDIALGRFDQALQREYLEDILPATEEGIRRVVSIVADLRRFSRGESLEGGEFDINEEVMTAVRLCDVTLREYRVTLTLGAPKRLLGRSREIAQVAMNLLVNAAQASRKGGEIRVETASADGHVILRVIDSGTGISPEAKARLFEPFFTTKPVGEGTGLGLAVVHGIVQAHGGSIRVASEPDQGSEFEVRLPGKPPV